MKRIVLAILFLAALSGPAFGVNDYDDAVAVWRFENGSGEGLNDSTANGQTLTEVSDVWFPTSPVAEGTYSVQFSASTGVKDYLTIADASLVSGFPYKSGETNRVITVTAWVQWGVLPDPGVSDFIVGKWTAAGDKRSFGLYLKNDGGTYKFILKSGYNSGANEDATAVLTAPGGWIATGTWYHVAYSINASGTYYLQAWNGSSEITLTSATWSNGAPSITTSAFSMIGDGGGVAFIWRGNMDEVIVFARALSADEMTNVREGDYTAPAAPGGGTYYADATAETSGDGSEESPWKTLDDVAAGLDALASNGEGDTVIFTGGTEASPLSYGRMDAAYWESAKSDYVTLQAAEGAWPQIDNETTDGPAIPLETAEATNLYHKIDGFRICLNNPTPLPTDDGHWHYTDAGSGERSAVRLTKVGYVQLLNCEIQGTPHRWLTKNCVALDACAAITIQGCKVHGACDYGITYSASSDVSVVGNVVWDLGVGGAVANQGYTSGDILWDRIHVLDCYSPYTDTGVSANEAYLPYNEIISSGYHQSSNFVIRAYSLANNRGPAWDSFIMRRCVEHDAVNTGAASMGGGSQALYCYDGWGWYDAMTVESNVFYSAGVVRFQYCNGSESRPVIFRNNTSIGGRNTIATNPDVRAEATAWFNGGFQLGKHAEAASYAYVFQYNNLTRGRVSTTYAEDDSLTSNYNIWFAPSTAETTEAWAGENDLFATWLNAAPDYSIRGNPNFMGDIGWYRISWLDNTDYTNTEGDKDYDFSENGTPAIFTNPDRRDYTLTGTATYMQGSVDLDTYGDPTTQSTYSMGTFDEDGFILADGQARDADHHSVGAYEAGATLGHPVRPTLPFPFHREFDVDVDENLTWTAGIGAATYNVYLGTDRALVIARDASTKKSSAQPGTTYDPPSDLSAETVYYWAVDSLDAESDVGNGVLWQFTTEGEAPSDGSAHRPAISAWLNGILNGELQ